MRAATGTAIVLLLLLLGCAALVQHLRRRRFEDAALVTALGALSLLAVRNAALYAVVTTPALCTALDDFLRGPEREGARRAHRAPGRALLCAALGYALLNIPRGGPGAWRAPCWRTRAGSSCTSTRRARSSCARPGPTEVCRPPPCPGRWVPRSGATGAERARAARLLPQRRRSGARDCGLIRLRLARHRSAQQTVLRRGVALERASCSTDENDRRRRCELGSIHRAEHLG
jgi:hypothetical protein